MGNITSCCEPAANSYPYSYSTWKDLQFEAVDKDPEITNPKILERINQLSSKNPLKIDKDKHQHAQIRMPMKQKSGKFIYAGQWINNKPDGYGKIYFTNGDYFEGQFYEGVASGIGRYFYTDGRYFQGHIHDNKAKGQGKYVSNQVTFQGTWIDSNPESGIYNLSDGTKIRIQKPPKGYIIWTDGRQYQGQLNSQLNPSKSGKMVFPNKNSYQGQWTNGLINGFGTYTWHDGRKYQGFYQNGVKEGVGTYYFSPIEKYQGQWKHGKQQGKGTLYKNNKIVYQGQFKDGHPVSEEKSHAQIIKAQPCFSLTVVQI